MADDEQETTIQQEPTTPEVPQKPTEAPKSAPIVQTAATEEPKGDGKVLEVRHGDFKKIKDEARARGRSDALAELDEVAKEAGFASVADAIRGMKKPAATTATQPAPTQEVRPDMPKPIPDKDKERTAKAEAKHAEEKKRMRSQWRGEERRRRDLQRQLDAKDAEMELREEMYTFGVTDVDYGLRLLTRELQGKSEEEIGKFDRKAFFDGVRQQKPYLFGEKVIPATTGTTGAVKTGDGAAPATPIAGDPAASAAAANKFDARTAKPEDVQKRLRDLGLNPHAAP